MTTFPRTSGFTLLELIVALAAASLFLGLLSGALGDLTTRTRQMLGESAMQTETLSAARFIAQTVKLAIPPNPRDPASQLLGTSTEISFNATAPDSMRALGPLRFRFYSDNESPGVKSLFVDAEILNNMARSPTFVLKKKRLLKNIQFVSFRYYEKTPAGTKQLSQWNDSASLPTLIQLSVMPANDLEPISISAMPRRHVDGQCRFDPVSLNCRY